MAVETTTLRQEVTELLQELIRIDTTNPPGNETAAAELLRDYLEDSGVSCELYAKIPERANLVARIIGDQVVGTQGTPVEVLGKMIHHNFFPALWRARNQLTARAKEEEADEAEVPGHGS